MKMIKTIYILPVLLIFIVTGCEKYEDYTGDYDYSTVYFGTQTPVRTVVARNEEMSFRFGVSLGGKYKNEVDEYVEYSIDTSLLRT
ncbi:MAG: hypothetical protein MI922_08760, partial [Bacteroidales bacterium]|nr:hypothetical protein [Bacteroidales bacterium]